jgi:heat shock protein HslJ
MKSEVMAKSGIALALAAFVAACGAATPFTKIDGTDSAALSKLDGSWVVINTGGTDVQSMNPPATMTFDTAARTVSGFDGCNDFNGSYTFEDGRLRANVAGTRRACTSDAARTVSARINNLFTEGAEAVDTNFMGAEVLMLANDNGDVRMAPPEMLNQR